MLFLVVALFLICWFPLQLYNFLNVYKTEINEYVYITTKNILKNLVLYLVLNILLYYGYAQIGLPCQIHVTIHLFTGFAVYDFCFL